MIDYARLPRQIQLATERLGWHARPGESSETSLGLGARWLHLDTSRALRLGEVTRQLIHSAE